MKRILLPAVAAAALILAQGGQAKAAAQANGTLAVTASVVSSIGLVFDSATGAIALTGSGTNAATMAFGSVGAYGGTVPTGVTRTYGTNNWTLNTSFDVDVTLVNSTSASYNLTCNLVTADPTNTWAVAGTTMTTTAVPIGTGETYNTDVPFTFALTIPNATTSGTNISNTLSFTATAN